MVVRRGPRDPSNHCMDRVDRPSVLQIAYRSPGCAMSVVTVSPKYQVVIPKEIREKLGIRPGQKVQAFAIGSSIELVPIEPIESLRGAFADLPAFEREQDRDL